MFGAYRGGRGKSGGPRNQAGWPRVQVHMKARFDTIGLALVTATVLAACSSPQAPGIVAGAIRIPVITLPSTVSALLSEQVIATNSAGQRFTVKARADSGQFRLSLPPGTYQVTGTSSGGCTRRHVHVTTGTVTRGVTILCSP